MVASWIENDGVALIAPLLLQPIAPADMAGDVPLPGADAELAATSFEEWLAIQAA